MMQVVVVDYGSGNLQSVGRALAASAEAAGCAADITITDDAETVSRADRIVLPGVGAFGDCARAIAGRKGLRAAIDHVAVEKARPFLGICVGMQLMAEYGLEDGRHSGFGWVKGRVDALAPDSDSDGDKNTNLKIPHMGWNALRFTRPHALWDGLADGVAVYFLHGFGFTTDDTDRDSVLGTCDYGGTRIAAIGAGNKIGLQFHPEKSQAPGLRILGNWLQWTP